MFRVVGLSQPTSRTLLTGGDVVETGLEGVGGLGGGKEDGVGVVTEPGAGPAIVNDVLDTGGDGKGGASPGPGGVGGCPGDVGDSTSDGPLGVKVS